MIGKITGTVAAHTETYVIVDVAGVGYLVHTNGLRHRIGEEVSFWTYLAVRETALDLYGFVSQDELEVFELLLTVPKIGPKSAAQILAQSDISTLKQAVAEQDASYLSKISGIGKKTAENIVLGLKTKAETWSLSYTKDAPPTHFQQEAIDALITLGYPHKDARDAIKSLPNDILTTNDAIKAALKQLSGN